MDDWNEFLVELGQNVEIHAHVCIWFYFLGIWLLRTILGIWYSFLFFKLHFFSQTILESVNWRYHLKNHCSNQSINWAYTNHAFFFKKWKNASSTLPFFFAICTIFLPWKKVIFVICFEKTKAYNFLQNIAA